MTTERALTRCAITLLSLGCLVTTAVACNSFNTNSTVDVENDGGDGQGIYRIDSSIDGQTGLDASPLLAEAGSEPCAELTCQGVCVPSDIHNCGTCGNVCPSVANASVACANSSCSFSCDTNYILCNGACALNSPDTTHGLFVAPNGALASCGSESAPCGSITAALTMAAQSSGTLNIIYISAGTYTEQVTLPAGITLQGSWLDVGGAWSRTCPSSPASSVVIQAPATETQTVIAHYSGSSTLDTLTVASKGPSSVNPGESLFGVFATGASTQLTLTNVIVNVSAAGAGITGATGTAGATPLSAGDCTEADGGAGGNGSNGNPGAGASSAGTYSATGYTPQSGQAGTAGTAGQSGNYGTGGTCAIGAQDCSLSTSGCSMSLPVPQSCGFGGLYGCPSGGSGPGSGGQGGGSSIGVFAWDAPVVITKGSVTVGNGGEGGNGGAPGTTVPGSAGGAGHVGIAIPKTCTTHCAGSDCTCNITATTSGAPGGTGSSGGTGGAGGQGGGGAGGDSFCYVQSPTNPTISAPGLQCTPGTAGAGGNNSALSGNAGMHN